jgi:ribonuclease HI
MKYITIFADASHCQHSKAAGIAVWARDVDKFYHVSQPLTFTLPGSVQAEMLALGTGILSVIREFDHQPGDRLSIQSDCKNALDLFAPVMECKKLYPFASSLRERVLEAVEQAGLVLCPKHVKGHQGNRDARSAINTWCDKQARAQMHRARNMIYVPQNDSIS